MQTHRFIDRLNVEKDGGIKEIRSEKSCLSIENPEKSFWKSGKLGSSVNRRHI